MAVYAAAASFRGDVRFGIGEVLEHSSDPSVCFACHELGVVLVSRCWEVICAARLMCATNSHFVLPRVSTSHFLVPSPKYSHFFLHVFHVFGLTRFGRFDFCDWLDCWEYKGIWIWGSGDAKESKIRIRCYGKYTQDLLTESTLGCKSTWRLKSTVMTVNLHHD